MSYIDFVYCISVFSLLLHLYSLAFVYDTKELPPSLSEYPLDKIYNFDESGLLYRLLATHGNVIGATKDRRGTKLAKDRITVGFFCNATGADIWKPTIIGAAKKPRCFGNHWTTEKAGVIYYNNEPSWMKACIWLDMLHTFNASCYDKRPVVLLADNCHAHKPPLGSTSWQQGNLQGYKMSNILLIYFEPNCTYHVQPLDAGNCFGSCLSCR